MCTRANTVAVFEMHHLEIYQCVINAYFQKGLGDYVRTWGGTQGLEIKAEASVSCQGAPPDWQAQGTLHLWCDEGQAMEQHGLLRHWRAPWSCPRTSGRCKSWGRPLDRHVIPNTNVRGPTQNIAVRCWGENNMSTWCPGKGNTFVKWTCKGRGP